MKYWLFDGEDVIGPFSPQEIAARAGFSDSILVCPETQSENEKAWQTASHFEDFSPEKLSARSQKQNTPAPTVSTPTKVPLAITSVPISSVEGEDPIFENKSAPQDATQKETDAINVQVQKVTLPTEETPKQQDSTPVAAAKSEETTSAGTQKSLPEDKKDPGEISSHSLPILGVSENTLPPLPVGDITFYTPSKEPAEWDQPQDEPVVEAPQKTLPPTAQVAETKPASANSSAPATPPAQTPMPQPEEKKETPANQLPAQAPETPKQAPHPAPKAETKKQTSVQGKPNPTPKPTASAGASKPRKTKRMVLPSPDIPEDSPEDFFAQTLSPFSQIPVELIRAQDKEAVDRVTQQPLPIPIEPEDFIPQKSSAVGKRFLLFTGILFTLLFLLVVAGCWLARTNRASASHTSATAMVTPAQVLKDTPTNQAAATQKAKPVSAKVTRPDIPVPPPPTVTIAPLQEKALEVVKNHKLSNQRGTIENYFNKLYSAQLSQGYQAAWSAEPLHKSTYIVKYRLTKTRTEPVVYVFQVDTSTGKLTGALNNITLDLVGKI